MRQNKILMKHFTHKTIQIIALHISVSLKKVPVKKSTADNGSYCARRTTTPPACCRKRREYAHTHAEV